MGPGWDYRPIPAANFAFIAGSGKLYLHKSFVHPVKDTRPDDHPERTTRNLPGIRNESTPVPTIVFTGRERPALHPVHGPNRKDHVSLFGFILRAVM